MTPERIRGFLRKPPHGAKRVQLVVEVNSALNPVSDWTREDIDTVATDPSQDVAAEVMLQAQEYTDAADEPQKFLLRWLGTRDRILKTLTHHCQVSPKDESDPGVISDSTIIRELLDANHKLQGQLLESHSTVHKSYRDALASTGEQLKQQAAVIDSLRKQIAKEESNRAAIVQREQTGEEKEESIQRAAALQAFTDLVKAKGGDGVDLILAAIAKKVLPPAPGEETPETH